jgi:hypothetical protein
MVSDTFSHLDVALSMSSRSSIQAKSLEKLATVKGVCDYEAVQFKQPRVTERRMLTNGISGLV